MSNVEQARTLRDALDVLKLRDDTALNRGMRATVTFALADHNDPHFECAGNESGGDCSSVRLARQILAGEV